MDRMWKIVFLCALIAGVASQEGRTFLLAFPPERELKTDGLCQIIINSDTSAEITIEFYDSTEQFSIDAGSYTHNLSCTIRAPPGHSDKAIILQSNVDVYVQMFTSLSYRGEAYVALPVKYVAAEYVLITTDFASTTALVGSVFTIAAQLDETVVQVYAPAPGGYTMVDSVTLNKFGTYTNNSARDTDVDFTGWKLRSEKPIAVVTGSSGFHATSYCTAFHYGYVFAPSSDQAGYQFIVPTIILSPPGGQSAFVRVISLSQSNMVELLDQSITETLKSGEFLQYHLQTWDEIVRVQCTEECVVVIFNQRSCTAGDGGFLMFITPLQDRVESIYFAAIEKPSDPSILYNNFVTIVSDTTNIRRNGLPISGWRAVPEWPFHIVSLEIENGYHTLHSTDEGKFVAFEYGHMTRNPYSYGVELVRNGVSGEVPTYRISLTSDWTSSQNMVTSCATQYNDQLRLKTLQMTIDINNELGETICVTHATKMTITSSASTFYSATASGLAFVSFVLTPDMTVAMEDVLICAEEIANNAKPHTTWGAPLLDPIPDCANPVFESGMFEDGDHQWICVNEQEIIYENMSPIPSKFVEVKDVGTTDDGSDLTPECTIRYSMSLDNQAVSMQSDLNTKLGNKLCSGHHGITAAVPQSSFSAMGSSALLHIDFILINDYTVTASEAILCAAEVQRYLQVYVNWGVPVLPPESGCPDIVFQYLEFDESRIGWICNVE